MSFPNGVWERGGELHYFDQGESERQNYDLLAKPWIPRRINRAIDNAYSSSTRMGENCGCVFFYNNETSMMFHVNLIKVGLL